MEHSQDRGTAVDDYLAAQVLGPDPVLESALERAAGAGLPQIQVTPAQGRLLFLLARMAGARAILEVGTLGGYSAICLARALPPDGRLVSLELDPRHADVARTNVADAGLSHVVDIRLGRALDTLRALEQENAGPFDMVFIDADKVNSPEYFRWAVRLSRAGTVIVLDNAIRHGAVLDAESADPDVVGTRAVIELMGSDPRVTATVIQTVGGKGYDGFGLAVVTDPAST